MVLFGARWSGPLGCAVVVALLTTALLSRYPEPAVANVGSGVRWTVHAQPVVAVDRAPVPQPFVSIATRSSAGHQQTTKKHQVTADDAIQTTPPVSTKWLVPFMAAAVGAAIGWLMRGRLSRPTAHAPTSKRYAILLAAAEAGEEKRAAAAPAAPRWSWQQTMLRVKDPARSLAFYRDQLGFTLLDRLDFPDMKFSLYFLTTLPTDQPYTLAPGTPEAHQFLWTFKGVTLELTHNWGTEPQADFSYYAGNNPGDGFGHIAVACDDVEACCAELEVAGVAFKKRPNEGRMKGLAFAYDPDGYWVEIVRRGAAVGHASKYNFAQTMLRVRDPVKSLAFYQGLGMTLLSQRHFSDFSLYFLATLPEGTCPPPSPDSPEAMALCNTLHGPVLELTHNHGTETQEDFAYDNGNTDGRRGFGHIGFLVEDVAQACAQLEPLGYGFVKRPEDGRMKGLAFARDPDGYWVEIIKRGGYDAEATPYWLEAPAQ